MSPDQFRAEIATLRTWEREGVWAPHKPLLVLYALARFADGIERLPYSATTGPLVALIEEFGPPRKNYRPYSFQRLSTSRLWEVDGADRIGVTASGDWKVREAREVNPVGHFSVGVREVLTANPALISEAAYALLNAHFPPSVHGDILTAIGLDPENVALGLQQARPERDPKFRKAVLRAYGYRCAVCGYDIRLGNKPIGLEAAHVQWHSAGGPDDVTNGLALCVLHHKLLDKGAYTLRPDADFPSPVLEVYEDTHGGEAFDDWLMEFHQKPISAPISDRYRVADRHIRWHRKTFRKPART